jgi:hypothetical protein
MEHAEARELLSARLDGELPPERAPALEAHLASCGECRAFADGVMRLHALAAELPREEPGRLFARTTVPAPLRPRRAWRLAPALAAVLAVILFMVFATPPGFKVPVAAAAERLTSISTFYAEREITDSSPFTTTERIWFRAPNYLRVERVGDALDSLTIRRPGELFEGRRSGGTLTTGLPPDADVLPEPLSPTIALLGRIKGAGPTITGHPTLRYVLDLGNGRVRTADVDAHGYEVLGIKESLIFGKTVSRNGAVTTTKRVTAFQLNIPIDDSIFAIPQATSHDAGFHLGPVTEIAAGPISQPRGFDLVAAGSGPDGSRILYARGSFPLQIDISKQSPTGDQQTSITRSVTVAGHTAFLMLDLYALPRISFDLKDRVVTITAPMTQAELVDTAEAMFFG